jgi:predicted secreted protein
MTFATGVVVYVMIWVVALFMVLPWGVRLPDRIVRGHADSAPDKPYKIVNCKLSVLCRAQKML